MKTQTLRFNLTTHDRKRTWELKPSFIKSKILYDLDGKSWTAPSYEFGWLFLTFNWTAYNLKEPYMGKYKSEKYFYEEEIFKLKEEINNLKQSVKDYVNDAW